MEFNFKKVLSLEKRKEEYQKIKSKLSSKIPIICEKDPRSLIEPIAKTKFLVNPQMNVSSFNEIIRKKLNLEAKEGIFLLVKGKNVITGNQTMQEIYEHYKDEDGFLYITYASESVWGTSNECY
jgi:hypothetical protein